ncbi:hypothetical protein DL764_002601 [Monosporascus ibericus]|uniref:EthD domain-containing protein n=1 Tax=Monosporascus ibericus TaxID=155417 RepID=A0A4Q4TJQ7_9PEZI|nr:hypothetical protein DL764_002601 [Monosporascus ibericus]
MSITPMRHNNIDNVAFKQWMKRLRDWPLMSKTKSANHSVNGLTLKISDEPDSPVSVSSCPASDLTTSVSNANSPPKDDPTSPITEPDSPERDNKLMCMAPFRRKPGMTAREFYDHWEHVHGPLVRSWVEGYGFLGYTQVRLTPNPLRNSRIQKMLFADQPLVHLKPELDAGTPTAPESSEEPPLASFDGYAIMEIRDFDQFAAAFQDEYYLNVIAPDEKALFDIRPESLGLEGRLRGIF